MTAEIDETDKQGNPKIVTVDEKDADDYRDIGGEIKLALRNTDVHFKRMNDVGNEVWVITTDGVITLDTDYRTGEFIIDLKDMDPSVKGEVGDRMIDIYGGDHLVTQKGLSEASQDDVEDNYGVEPESPSEYTSGIGVSGAHSGKGDVAAEITIYEDGTYDFTNMKGGNNHEAVFSAIIAIQDRGDETLIPLMITEDGWGPGISGVNAIVDSIKEAFRNRL
jgi:hypothetical protein